MNSNQTNLSILLDINDDGINDFELKYQGFASPGAQTSYSSIAPLGSNSVAASNIDSSFVDTLSYNSVIGDSLNWKSGNLLLYSMEKLTYGTDSFGGLWGNANNKFIAIKIVLGNNVLYGWISVKIVNNGWGVAVFEYATSTAF